MPLSSLQASWGLHCRLFLGWRAATDFAVGPAFCPLCPVSFAYMQEQDRDLSLYREGNVVIARCSIGDRLAGDCGLQRTGAVDGAR